MTDSRANQLVEAGVWLQATGDRPGARRLFEQALKMDPTNARAQQLLAESPLAAPAPSAPGTPASAPPANPFTRQSVLEALADLEFQSSSTMAPPPGGPLPYDLPVEIPPGRPGGISLADPAGS